MSALWIRLTLRGTTLATLTNSEEDLMMRSLVGCALGSVLILGMASSSEAIVIFADDFNTANGGTPTLNWNGLPNWTLSGGSVDLIGTGSGGTAFDFLPGNGLYVDLDGSTGNAVDAFSHAFSSLAAGTYLLSFDLAGNQRNGAFESVTVTFGLYSEVFDSNTFTASTPFITIQRVVTVGAN